MDLSRKQIEETLRKACNKKLQYAILTVPLDMMDAVIESLDQWGYKVARNNDKLLVILGEIGE